MSIWAQKSRIIITCAKGISPFLKEEVISLGFPVLSEDAADIETEGTMNDTMGLNLFIRTGHRVLFLIGEFGAKNPEELYRGVSSIPWEDYLPPKGYISVTSTVDNPTIQDVRFANLKCKDGIVDRMKAKCGRRPDSGPRRDRIVIHVYWKGDLCDIYLDTSGEPLSRRGYRRISLRAPMQESLAAALVLATQWNGERNFINPMCGSGTLAIEAAWIALNRAPGLLRNNFGFMHVRGFNESSWRALHQMARSMTKRSLNGRIIATDLNPEAVEAAKKNAFTAGVQHLIEFEKCDYSKTPVPEGGGIVLLNPEYGERMGEIEALKETYKGIGDFFKKNCQGYTGYLFTGNLNLAKKVGLRTKRRIPFFNGPIECRLLEYELYEGSRGKRRDMGH